MKSWWNRAQPLTLILAAAVAFGACDEQLDSGGACPLLCPVRQAQVRDTTFFAVALDTSVAGFPSIGIEPVMFLASFGDTLQTRGVVRFDDLPKTFRRTNSATDSAIVAVDTGAVLRLYVAQPDTTGVATTVEAYDVDLRGAEEANPNAVSGAFTPDRLLGSRTFPAKSLKDSIEVPIDPAKLLAKVQTDTPMNRLRVGLRVTSPGGSAKLSIFTTNQDPTTAPALIFRPSAGDTSVAKVVLSPSSKTPPDPTLADALKDYLVVSTPPPPPPAGVVRVGSLPGRRAYLRFNVPSSLIDSTDIIRATLILTQRPSLASPQPRDTVGIQTFVVTAGSALSDLGRALQLLLNQRADTLRFVPTDSGPRALEIIEAVRFWRATKPERTPRAIALRLTQEGRSGSQIDFFSTAAPAAVRPVLRITYLPRQTGGGALP